MKLQGSIPQASAIPSFPNPVGSSLHITAGGTKDSLGFLTSSCSHRLSPSCCRPSDELFPLNGAHSRDYLQVCLRAGKPIAALLAKCGKHPPGGMEATPLIPELFLP
ncbi:MAG: hypothetical protein EBR40_00150 [Proteobacteria bacterium]|nr:hypothetical protein [Pseudomonadota bacterium]